MSDDLKPPCRGCDHEFTSKRQPPCDTCLLPGQYADAVDANHFPTMDFLRQSRPDHWGIKKDKEKREMKEKAIYYKTCEQCGESKRADQYFHPTHLAKDGYRKICAKCDKENKGKEGQEETMAIEEAAGTPVNEEAVNIGGVYKDIEAEIKEDKEKGAQEKAVAVTGEVKSLTIEEIDEALKEGAKGIMDLEEYCSAEGTTVAKVTSDLKTPAIAEARRNIARAMHADGVKQKIIALKLKIGSSTLWNYLQDEKPEVDEPEPGNGNLMIEVDFSENEELYGKILVISKDRLRKPKNQMLWWLRNTDFDKLNKGLSSE